MADHVAKHDGPEFHSSEADEKPFSKVRWHLLPLLIICCFIGYLLFEVPRNLMLEKIGARAMRCA